MTNCPDRSATARSWTSPLRNSSTLAFGAAVPAITASPARPTTATSKTGLIASPLPGEGDGTVSVGGVERATEPLSATLDAGDATVRAAFG